jgi:hypothetical protein
MCYRCYRCVTVVKACTTTITAPCSTYCKTTLGNTPTSQEPRDGFCTCRGCRWRSFDMIHNEVIKHDIMPHDAHVQGALMEIIRRQFLYRPSSSGGPHGDHARTVSTLAILLDVWKLDWCFTSWRQSWRCRDAPGCILAWVTCRYVFSTSINTGGILRTRACPLPEL